MNLLWSNQFITVYLPKLIFIVERNVSRQSVSLLSTDHFGQNRRLEYYLYIGTFCINEVFE